MEDKSRLITPFFMLFAGAIASIIMYVRGYDFNRMLWALLIVLVIFYFIGDTVRYIYSRIRPRIIPDVDYSEMERIARTRFFTAGVQNSATDNDDSEGESAKEESEDTIEEEYADSESDIEGEEEYTEESSEMEE